MNVINAPSGLHVGNKRDKKILFLPCRGRTSPVLRDVLEKYRELFHINPAGYLFEGQETGRPYSTRSAQIIFKRAVKDAGIQMDVTFHVLRASFATHLLEKGVDIKYIKELLGHFDIKTTERYLHVAREKLVNIQSPLDFLNTKI